jgi:hypothetical protein
MLALRHDDGSLTHFCNNDAAHAVGNDDQRPSDLVAALYGISLELRLGRRTTVLELRHTFLLSFKLSNSTVQMSFMVARTFRLPRQADA